MIDAIPLLRLALALSCALGGAAQDAAPPGPPLVRLVVKEGRPLRVVLDARVRVKRAGQPVSATLVEPVYAYDRVVIPAGVTVQGHIEALRRVPAGRRLLHALQLDFSPPRAVTLRFDRLLMPSGEALLLSTRVGPGTADVVFQSAAPPRGVVSRARDEVAEKARRTAAAVRSKGRMRRLRDALVQALPFHPQYLAQGTTYDAELLAALDFGTATPIEPAPAGTLPPPEAILSARLVTAVDSARSPRGTAIEALLTRPLLSAGGQLILPEGTSLTGQVTFARPARHLRRNGALRVLFAGVRVPGQAPDALLASLHGAEVARGARLAIDDEGGATVTTPKTRFVGPAVALGALGAATLMEPVASPEEVEPGVLPGALEPNSMGTAAGGFSGLGLIGIGLGRVSRPMAIGLGAVGLARSLYVGFFGRGREVSFPAGTRIQVQLAPGPPPEQP